MYISEHMQTRGLEALRCAGETVACIEGHFQLGELILILMQDHITTETFTVSC